jgi:hypothetical protein
MQPIQWVGVGILLLSVLLSRWDDGLKAVGYQPIPVPGVLGRLPPFIDPNDPNA